MTSKRHTWNTLPALAVAILVAAAGPASAQMATLLEYQHPILTLAAETGAGSGQAAGAVKDDLFAGTEMFAKGATGVTEITMDPETLGMVSGKEGHQAHSMLLNVVRTYSYDKPGMYRMEDVDAYRNKLNSGDWHCSVHTRDLKNGGSTDVCNKARTDGIRETAIVTVEPRSLTFIHTIRRAPAPGQSDLGEGPMFSSLSGFPAFAMINPGMFLELRKGMREFQQFDLDSLHKNLDELRGHEFELKELRDPELRQRLDKMRKQMDESMREFKRGAEAPKAPEAPKP